MWNNGLAVSRFTPMVISALLCTTVVHAQGTEGYYKDLFMDGGVELTSRATLAAADLLGLSYDVLATSSETTQKKMMVESAEDKNGCLLYPDGAPRYRVIYTNGGSATGHGTSLGPVGRQRVKDFFAAGGSYTGSCAGAFLAMIHNNKPTYDKNGPYKYYYGLWPGIGRSANTLKQYHDIHFKDLTHPLVKKYPSLADGLVSNVYHNGGCRFQASYFPMPKGTEYLGVMHAPSLSGLHGYYNVMAWKQSSTTGRVVVTCSHPEGKQSGEQRDFTAALISYALDGIGAPPPAKGLLQNGAPRSMNTDATRLGDRQYHYWTVILPPWTAALEVTLVGLSADSHLYLSRNVRPTRLKHQFRSDAPGNANEKISAKNPGPGTWYVGIYGPHSVKNGAAYTVRAGWTVGTPPADSGPPPPTDGGPPPPADGGGVKDGQPARDGASAPDGLIVGGDASPDRQEGGCNCRVGGKELPGVVWVLLLLVWALRARVRARAGARAGAGAGARAGAGAGGRA